MADEDSKTDDDYVPPDDEPIPVKPRPKAKNFAARASAPSVERSLDRFIEEAKAEPHAHDVSYFQSEKREDLLAKKVEDLEKRLSAAEARADKAEKAARDAEAARVEKPSASAIETPPPRRGVGGMIAAFVLGGALVFGATRLVQSDPPSPQTAATPQPAAEPVHTAELKRPTVTPIEEAPAVAPPTTPVIDKPVIEKPADKPVVDKPVIDKPLKRPTVAVKQPVTPVKDPPKEPPKDSPPKDPPKPPDPKPTGDEGLYNPFGK